MSEETTANHTQKSDTQQAPVQEWKVEGMTCSNCAQSIQKSLEEEGLENVDVNFSTGTVRFAEDPQVSPRTIEQDIERLGYQVANEDDDGDQAFRQTFRRFLGAAILTLPLFSSMFLPFAFLQNPYVQMALAAPVYALGAYQFGRSAWYSLKSGIPNMDVLIFIGSTAAFGYSLTGTILQLGPAYQFYETAATIITLVLLGNVMEQRAVSKTTTAIDKLAALRPQQAKRVSEGNENKGAIEQIPADQLREGDVVQVNAGDSIPADGILTWGDCDVDESMITGESMPVIKKTEMPVIGGTIVQQGNGRLRVNATGQQTVLSRIIDMVKQAQASKPSIQKLSDKVSAIFVPVVLSIALLTFSLSYWVFDVALGSAILRSVAVLVISCPCAMGLATPTAVMVGIGKAANQGILIKGGGTLEQMASIQRVVFDKTGTLTTGNFRITQFQNYSGDDVENRNAIHQIEQYSSHPIAESILRYIAGWKTLSFNSVNEVAGAGMEAELEDGTQYQLGSRAIFQDGEDYPEHHVYLLRNGELAAGLDLEDELKPNAREMVQYFADQGLETVMLSGDQQQKTQKLAERLSIDQVHAEKHPDEKLKILEDLSKEKPTAMVGDGVNDAPSLSRADIGVSLGHATEIAMQSAEVLLLDGRLESLSKAHTISNQTLKTIKENLFWAFSYNIVAIPIAALGFLNPMFAALAMAFSDVMVIGNSLRLKFR